MMAKQNLWPINRNFLKSKGPLSTETINPLIFLHPISLFLSKTLDSQNPLLTMSEMLHLVPSLNEMMEGYAKGEEEEVQATQCRDVQGGERAETRTEDEQSTKETNKKREKLKNKEQKQEQEETKKRRREVEEAGTQKK